MITLEVRAVFRCRCVNCGWEWEALRKPARCAKCKYLTWNGEDRRLDDIYTNVPARYRIERGTLAPRIALRPPEMLAALQKARVVVDQVVHDYGPCDHAKDQCVCEETKTLAQINRQIERLTEFIDSVRVFQTGETEAVA